MRIREVMFKEWNRGTSRVSIQWSSQIVMTEMFLIFPTLILMSRNYRSNSPKMRNTQEIFINSRLAKEIYNSWLRPLPLRNNSIRNLCSTSTPRMDLRTPLDLRSRWMSWVSPQLMPIITTIKSCLRESWTSTLSFLTSLVMQIWPTQLTMTLILILNP